MEFSSLIDVSSFFIGVLINLLLIALICYYFKRKFDNIEMAQSEQAKIIYNLIESRQQAQQIQQEPSSGLSFFSTSDLDKLNEGETKDVVVTNMVPEEGGPNVNGDELDSDSDSEDEDDITVATDSDDEAEESNVVVDHASLEVDVVEETNIDDIKTVDISSPEEDIVEEPISFEKTNDTVESEVSEEPEEIVSEYEKMTVKELREALNMKGYHVKSNMKKSEMLDLLQTPIDEPVVVMEEETNLEAVEDSLIELEE